MNKDSKAKIDSVKSYIDDCYFDFAGIPTSGIPTPIDEAQVAKMLARIAVSAVTIFTTTISLKQYFKDHTTFFNRKKQI